MIRKWWRKLALVLLALFVLAAGAVIWLVSTESGTRWLLARAQPYLPDALHINGVGGTVLSGFDIEAVVWQDENVEIDIESISIEFELRPLLRRHLVINRLGSDKLEVVSQPGTDSATGDDPVSLDIPIRVTVHDAGFNNLKVTTPDQVFELDRVSFAGTVSGDQLQLDRLDVDSDWLQLDGQFAGSIAPPYDVDAKMEWRLNKVVPMPLAGDLQLNGSAAKYQVRHDLALPVAVQSEGTLAIAAESLEFDINNRWNDIDWQLGESSEIQSPSGQLRIAGEPGAFAISSSFEAALDQWPLASVALSGNGSLEQLDVERLRLESDLVELAASGGVDWSGDPRWSVDFDVMALDTSQLDPRLDGLLSATGVATGRLPADDPLEVRLQIETASGVLNGRPVDGAILLDVEEGAIELSVGHVSVGENRFTASGMLLPSVDVSLDWDLPAISALMPAASGRSTADLQLRRSGNDWSVVGNIDGASLQWEAVSLGSVKVAGEISNHAATSATFAATSLEFENVSLDSLTTALSGNSDSHSFEASLLSGDLYLDLAGSGRYTADEWSGELDLVRLRDGPRSEWRNVDNAKLGFGKDSGAVDVCVEESNGTGRVCADTAFATGGDAQLEVVVRELPLAILPIKTLSEDIDVEGSVTADIEIVRQQQKLNGSASVRFSDTAITTDIGGESLRAALDRGEVLASISDNALTTEAELVFGTGGFVKADGGIVNLTDPGSEIAGKVRAEFDELSFVPLLVPAITETRGTITGSLDIEGSLGAPEFGGDLRLQDGSFRADQAGIAVSDIDVQLRQAVDRQLSFSGSARSGEGQVRISGDSLFKQDQGLVTTIAISGESFEFIRMPEWNAVASPDIRVVLDQQSIQVRGSLEIPQARVALNTIPQGAEKVSADAVVHTDKVEVRSAARQLDLDVEAVLGDSVELSGFGLDTRLAGALRLRGESNEPFVGTGRIDLHEGRYRAYGQDLDIQNGALIFAGPLTSPTLDVRATRRVDDVLAGLDLRGTPDNLQSSVFSEPPMSDAEALSYLVAGRPLASANDAESNRVGQAALALGLSGADKVVAQLQSKLGLDSLSLDSGDDIGRIVAGRRIGGRLLVEYGYGIADRLGTLLLRYQLNERIVVETTTGTARTLDVVYSVKKP